MRETVNSRPTTAAFANPDADPSAFNEDAQRVGDTVCKVIGPDGNAQPITVPSTGLLPITRAPLKRPLTLDLNAKLSSEGGTNIKRLRFTGNANGAPVPVLSTPDLQILKMASPELEKFMMDNNSLQTPTPSLLCPSKVTSEQEDYAKGFVDALNSLRKSETSQTQHTAGALLTTTASVVITNDVATAGGLVREAIGTGAATVLPSQLSSATTITTSSTPASVANNSATSTTTNSVVNAVGLSGGTFTYTNLDSSGGSSSFSNVSIKDEPQPVSSPPPHSPIDMDDQERIKLERKRMRNRVAASKCRKRKLERISKLEDKVKNLKGDNTDLAILVKQLKENVCSLKQQVIVHINTGCNIPSKYAAGGEASLK